MIISGLFFTLKAGIDSQKVGFAKAELQGQMRMALDWIVKDIRSAVCWDIADTTNNPNSAHIRFRQVTGWDLGANNYSLGSNYIEYSYDPTVMTITRTDSALPGASWIFKDITQAPFYTKDTSGSVVALNSGDLLTSRRIVVQISGQGEVSPSLTLNYFLSSEVKIRNE